MYGALVTIRARDLPEETRDELIEVAYEQSDRLRRLLEQLLDLSRLDAESISVSPRPIVLAARARGHRRRGRAGGVPVDLDVSTDLAAVADPLVLERVVSNLLANAARHGAPPITRDCGAAGPPPPRQGRRRGAGVPDDLRARLFDRFARGNTDRGSGLGLAIARTYAQAHGGDLVYDPLERGARFELIVPQD